MVQLEYLDLLLDNLYHIQGYLYNLYLNIKIQQENSYIYLNRYLVKSILD